MTDLEERLGHVFRDKKLLKRALTHASANGSASNERLEFLGDRVLGLIAAEKLHQLYPKDDEGALALKFNHLVRAEACAAAVEAAGIADHLILAKSESGSGGRRKIAITSGACEAVIAALYLDGGLEAVRPFIDRYWTEAGTQGWATRLHHRGTRRAGPCAGVSGRGADHRQGAADRLGNVQT